MKAMTAKNASLISIAAGGLASEDARVRAARLRKYKSYSKNKDVHAILDYISDMYAGKADIDAAKNGKARTAAGLIMWAYTNGEWPPSSSKAWKKQGVARHFKYVCVYCGLDLHWNWHSASTFSDKQGCLLCEKNTDKFRPYHAAKLVDKRFLRRPSDYLERIGRG